MKYLLILILLAGCATVPQPTIVANAVSLPPIEIPIPVACLKPDEKPALPVTAVTLEILGNAEKAVAALASPPPEIAKETLAEWIGAIDRLVSALMVDLYRQKTYIVNADVLLTGCATVVARP